MTELVTYAAHHEVVTSVAAWYVWAMVGVVSAWAGTKLNKRD